MNFRDIINNQIFRYTVLFSAFFLILSFCAYCFPLFNSIAFFIILAVFGVLAFKDLKVGALIVLAELFLNSKGYLFFLELGGNRISLRIAFFVIFISIFLAKVLNNVIEIKINKIRESKDKNFLLKIVPEIIENKKFNYLNIFRSSYFKYLAVFAFCFIASLSIGVLNSNFISNIFFDASGFLFFIYLIPFFDIFKKKDDFKDLLYVLIGSSIVVFIQSLFVLWMFSHNKIYYLNDIYRWTKDFGIGEITRFGLSNFYRVFFQSHIYLSSIFVFGFSYFIYNISVNKRKILPFLIENKFLLILTFLSSIVFILSFSRSFWLASFLTLGFVFLFAIVLKFFDKEIKLKEKIISSFKILFKTAVSISLILVLSFYSIQFFINFPKPNAYVDLSNAFSDRFSDPASEEAGSSRINMLKPLFSKIGDNFILGAGFGTTVKYKTADPTNVKKTVNAMYETFAFEWGYLDLLLKFGIVGFGVYMLLLFIIFKDFVISQFKSEDKYFKQVNFSLLACFVFLLSINLTTPYLNRPVGIGIIILMIVWINIFNNKKKLTS